MQPRSISAASTCTIYEQAPRFVRLGAGIQMTPNAMRVLRGIGLEPRIRATAFQPRSWTNRDWDTAALRYELPLGADAEAKYGAPYLLMHRGDLHESLASRVPASALRSTRSSSSSTGAATGVALRFANGTSAHADAVIGADGMHSRLREFWLGAETPNFTGRVAYRTTFPAALLERLRDRRMLQMVGPGPSHRDLLHHGATRRGLFRHQPAGAEFAARILVGDRRPRDAAARVRRLSRAGAARRGAVPARAQVGDRRS